MLENGFLFVADLVRAITCEVHCEFVKPYTHVFRDRNTETTLTPAVVRTCSSRSRCIVCAIDGFARDFTAKRVKSKGWKILVPAAGRASNSGCSGFGSVFYPFS